MTDVIGANAVANYIEQANCSKFIISRSGAQKNTIPVFECIHTHTPKQARENFLGWANNLISGNPGNATIYEMVAFNGNLEGFDDELNEDEGQPSGPRKRKKNSQKVKFSFQLSGGSAPIGREPGTPPSDYISRGELNGIVESAIGKVIAEREKQDLIGRIEELEAEIEDLSENPKNGTNDMIMGLIQSYIQSRNQPGAAAGAINGEPEKDGNNENDKVRLTTALKKLRAADKDYISTLEKLADISEKNPVQFQQYLNIIKSL